MEQFYMDNDELNDTITIVIRCNNFLFFLILMDVNRNYNNLINIEK